MHYNESMKVTTKSIIKILPLDKDLKTSLLDDFDTLDPDKKFIMEGLLWDSYHALYKLKLEENLQKAFIHAHEGTQELDQEMYKKVKKETNEQMDKDMREEVEATDLAEARRAMEMIIKEIQASKK